MISIDETNKLIRYASKIFDKLFEGRFLIESKLFPVSEYILAACANSYEKFYDQLLALNKKISAKKIALQERGKLFTEITPLHIFNIQMFPFFGRTCRISNFLHDDPILERQEIFDKVRYILSFWKELASNYYGGPLSVDEMGGNCQIASKESLEIIKKRLNTPEKSNEISEIKKLVANIEQLAFLDECETRMKISNHGPYYINSDELIIVKEIVRLYDGNKAQWPWSETKVEAPYSNILIAYQLKGDIECQYNDWGTLKTNPIDYKDKIIKYCLISKKGNKIIELDDYDRNQFDYYVKNARKELYIKYAKWTKKERLEAGILVYNKNFDRFTNLVGITDEIDWSISENVRNNELKRFINNEIVDFKFGNWIMRSNRKRKIIPTYFTREKISDFKKVGSFYR